MPDVFNASKEEITLYSLDRDSVVIQPRIISSIDQKFLDQLPKIVSVVGSKINYRTFAVKGTTPPTVDPDPETPPTVDPSIINLVPIYALRTLGFL